MATRTTPRRVLIESPYGRNQDGSRCNAAEYDRNTRYVRRAILDCLLRGEAPFASHALYPLSGMRDDDPADRRVGMVAGFAWGECAELIAVYSDHGITEGMAEGMRRWDELGIPVVNRLIGKESMWAGHVTADALEKAPDLMRDQPPPVHGARAVWDMVVVDMKQRDRDGERKYGCRLSVGDGRDAMVDAYQEALDLVVYLRKALEERG